MLPSYPKVYAIGHRNITGIFESHVQIQEKVDGSQFSFGRVDGVLQARSHGKELDLDNPEKMFASAVETIKGLEVREGWIYRGEVLSRPKHNTLVYGRVPEGNIILFDVTTGLETYLEGPELLQTEARAIGLESVPFYACDLMVDSLSALTGYLEQESVLGGPVEGIVVKNYARFAVDGSAMFGKLVSEKFKESHKNDWKNRNPNRADVVERVAAEFGTEARWRKVAQHMREDGQLLGDVKDIGPLIGQVQKDVHDEEEDRIKQLLFDHFWRDIGKKSVAGLAEWYKLELAQQEFKNEAD